MEGKKKVPWAHLEKYLDVHQVAIMTYMDQLKHKFIGVAELEEKLPKSFLSLHEVLTQILKENGILPS